MARVFHGLIALALLGAATAPVAALQRARALPAKAQAVLTATFPGWRFATIDPARWSELFAEPGVLRSAEWVSGDFNGDGRADVAAQIVRPGAADAAQIVVALLATPDDYAPTIIQALPEQTGTYLRVSKRGTRIRDLERDENGRVTIRLRHDAIDIVWIESAATTCLLASNQWRCVVSAD